MCKVVQMFVSPDETIGITAKVHCKDGAITIRYGAVANDQFTISNSLGFEPAFIAEWFPKLAEMSKRAIEVSAMVDNLIKACRSDEAQKTLEAEYPEEYTNNPLEELIKSGNVSFVDLRKPN